MVCGSSSPAKNGTLKPASIIWPKAGEMDIDLDLPEDFDPPFEDEPEQSPPDSPQQ